MALTPKISSLMKDLFMDDGMKGEAAGIFFIGYVLLQVPGGHLATRWSARKVISICLLGWGACAVCCGLARSFRQFEAARFFLGVTESAVFPSMLALLASWFPRAERARANAYWNLCQPLAVVIASLTTGALLQRYGWRQAIVLEGMLPFLYQLPVWWFCIRDPAERGEMDFGGGAGAFGDDVASGGGGGGAAVGGFVVGDVLPADGGADGGGEFSAQFAGLRVHDVFHEQPGGAWV